MTCHKWLKIPSFQISFKFIQKYLKCGRCFWWVTLIENNCPKDCDRHSNTSITNIVIDVLIHRSQKFPGFLFQFLKCDRCTTMSISYVIDVLLCRSHFINRGNYLVLDFSTNFWPFYVYPNLVFLNDPNFRIHCN